MILHIMFMHLVRNYAAHRGRHACCAAMSAHWQTGIMQPCLSSGQVAEACGN